jgi:hypothetical protein
MAFWKRKRKLVVVLATRHPRALAALDEAVQHLEKVQIERREALSVAGTYAALQGAHLAIVDPSALTGDNDEDEQRLEAALGSAGLVRVAGQTFVSSPVQFLEQAVATAGLGTMLPPRSVAFTGWGGGVGKTTLALATAKAFHKATNLPAAVIELAPGPSALRAVAEIAEAEGDDLYAVVSQRGVYPSWQGVTLALMDWGTAELLTAEQIREHWQALAQEHVFVAYDAPAWHPLAGCVDADQIYVLADARPDAQVEAVALAKQLRSNGHADDAVRLGLNQAGVAARIALPEQPAFTLNTTRRPLTLGRDVLRAIYPGWRG